jgi:hypothetical protein
MADLFEQKSVAYFRLFVRIVVQNRSGSSRLFGPNFMPNLHPRDTWRGINLAEHPTLVIWIQLSKYKLMSLFILR